MNLFDAMKCMIEGKKVRNELWDDGSYIYIDEFTGDILDEEGVNYSIRHINEDDTWEIYTEKVKKKEENMVSDDMGGFIYAYRSQDDENFTVIRMEVENGDSKYDKLVVELYKDDIKELINILINLL